MLTSTSIVLPLCSLNPTSNFVDLKGIVYPLTLSRRWILSPWYTLPGVTRRKWTMIRSSLTPKTPSFTNYAPLARHTELSFVHTASVLLKAIPLQSIIYNVNLNCNVCLLILMTFTISLYSRKLRRLFTRLLRRKILPALPPTPFD